MSLLLLKKKNHCLGEIQVKPRLKYGRYFAQLRRRRLRRAYVPSNITASHDNHENINFWVSFAFLPLLK